jgi:hypothetical protein
LEIQDAVLWELNTEMLAKSNLVVSDTSPNLMGVFRFEELA